MSSEKSRGNVIVNAIAKFLKIGTHTKAKRKCIAAVLPQNPSDHQSITMTMTPPRGPQLQDITNRQQVQQHHEQQMQQEQQQQQQQQQLLHSSLPQSQTQPWSPLHSQLQLQLHSQLQSQLQTQVDCQSQPQSQPHPQPQTQSQLRSQSRSKIQLQPQSLPPTEPQSLPPTEPQSLPPTEPQSLPPMESQCRPATKPQSRPPSKIHLQSHNESRIANNTRPKNNGAAAQASEKNSTEQYLSNVNESDRSSVTVPPVTIPSKHTARDFIFGKVIGEGSFSTVYLAKGVHCRKEYAIKVCEKRHILKEHKTEYIKREKEVLNLLSDNACPTAPFFVKLFSTFQDSDRLYFVLSYAKNGELLPYIHKVGSFDIECSRFYAGEILHALEHLHSLGIIHRDLKPENILLDDKMHIKITDFGSVKILEESPLLQDGNFSLSNSLILDESASVCDGAERYSRRNSFVGTAQYVSPELLSEKSVSKSSDIWALGCIIYQMVAGLPPFVARSEYVIFQKILQVIYEFPDGFDPDAKDLVQKLLIRDPQERLGSSDEGIYTSIRCQPFFKGINFETLYLQIPPPIYPYLPGTSDNEEMRSHYRVPDHLEPGLDDRQLTRLLGLDLQESEPERYETTGNFRREKSELMEKPETTERQAPEPEKHRKRNGIMDLSPEEIRQRLEQQQRESKWHDLVERNLILKQGLVDKRKGLFVRRRMLLLTMGPHLYYADPVDMVLKGEIPWSPELRVEPKNFKIFFVHTPNRTYYLEDRDGYALEWCKAIEDVRKYKYGLRL